MPDEAIPHGQMNHHHDVVDHMQRYSPLGLLHSLLKCFMGASDSRQYIPGVMVGIILGWVPDLEESYHDRVDNKDYVVVRSQCHVL
jgi:hypothetical protein